MSASGKDQPPLAEAQGVLFMTVPLPAALTHLPDRPRGIVCGAPRTPLHTDKNLNAPGVSDKDSLALSPTGSPLVR